MPQTPFLSQAAGKGRQAGRPRQSIPFRAAIAPLSAQRSPIPVVRQWRDAAEHHPNRGLSDKRRLDGRIVPLWYDVVVVQKVHEIAPCMWPGKVTDLAGKASGGLTCHIRDARVLKAVDDRFSRAFGTVVCHYDFDLHPGLGKYARDCGAEFRGPAERRHYDREIDGSLHLNPQTGFSISHCKDHHRIKLH